MKENSSTMDEDRSSLKRSLNVQERGNGISIVVIVIINKVTQQTRATGPGGLGETFII